MPRKRKPKADAPAQSSPEVQYQAIVALWTTFLHLRTWGLPEYEELTAEDREYFSRLVSKGREAVFAHVEDCKRAVLSAGLGSLVRDEWLGFLSAGQLDPVVGLPDRVRGRLARMLDDMYPLVVRLDPDAAHADSAEATGDQWPEGRTNQEVADFLSERAVKYRQLGQDCLSGKPGSANAFREAFSPSVIAAVINQKHEITAATKMCNEQDVCRTATYNKLIKPLMRKAPCPPESWGAGGKAAKVQSSKSKKGRKKGSDAWPLKLLDEAIEKLISTPQNKRTYDRLIDLVLHGPPDEKLRIVEEFRVQFGPKALAKAIMGDPEKRGYFSARIPNYAKSIQPVLHGRAPADWQPPPGAGNFDINDEAARMGRQRPVR